MPTRDRRRFVAQAVSYFLRQDYDNRELIIVDDGDDVVADLAPEDRRIRYHRCEGPRLPLGAKRNLGVELSQGELIAHWDDDDWIASDRLSCQVNELLACGADVCGAGNLLHYRPESGEAWLYSQDANDPPWVAGCTLLYRRTTWSEHPFPSISVGEDSAFVAGLDGRLHTSADSHYYVALIHPGNTAPKHLADRRWRRLPLAEVTSRLHHDSAFYSALRGAKPRPVDARSSPVRCSVTVNAPLVTHEGYGSMSDALISGMARAGARVDVKVMEFEPQGLSPEVLEIQRASRPQEGAPILYMSWLKGDLDPLRNHPELFIYTMWESSRLPASWPERLNWARAVMVPSRFVAEVCRASGVQKPIQVVPLGVDPEVYHFEDRPHRESLTTLVVATVVPRKHTLEAIEAWKLAFAGDPAARLIIKSRFQYRNYFPDDARIELVDRNEGTRGIAHWYRQADVVLALGSEGFGLPLVEGMATGLPVIALNSEGQRDVCEDAKGLLLPVDPARWEPAEDQPYGPAGVRGVPDVGAVASRLRWVAEHRDEAAAMGREASAWVSRQRDLRGAGSAVLEVMERHLSPRRSLRRPWTVWVSSWDTPCGIAEYTRYLAEAIPQARVIAKADDLQPAGVLHLQHEPSMAGQEQTSLILARAQKAGTPTVATLHAVGPGAAPWEGTCSALVSLSERGTAMLRARWPGRRVETIPHGCPTWFPPRKQSRGRVIGAHGFLARHKGFWRLLEVLDRLPGSELLVLSHARDAELEARWKEATRGRAVRWVPDFLPARQVAERLAQEADVVVYWYDEQAYDATSLAVRVGLASGVPVLTSHTSWFSDLAEATLQPSDLAEGVSRLLEDEPLRQSLVAAARDHCHTHSWKTIAERHLSLWRSLDN
jgi:glycosyltransferase involved in cell wall biosynthesis